MIAPEHIPAVTSAIVVLQLALFVALVLSPRQCRKLAAWLIGQATRVEAAREAARREGDASYHAAQRYLGLLDDPREPRAGESR